MKVCEHTVHVTAVLSGSLFDFMAQFFFTATKFNLLGKNINLVILGTIKLCMKLT